MQLLSRTIRTYLIYSLIIIISGMPILYFLLQEVINGETAELLTAQKTKIIAELEEIKTTQQLNYFLKLRRELSLKGISDTAILPDRVYRSEEKDPVSHEVIPYTIYSFHITVLNKPYDAKLKMSLLTEKALIRTILKTQLLVIAGLLCGLYLINKNMSRKIWQPFHITLQKLTAYEIHRSHDLDLPKSSIAEFELLNKTISHLVKKNHQVFIAQKEFTENAAHEMQTPLAILQGKLELLIQSENLNEEQAGVIGSMLDVCDRLSRLNVSLLLLSKIENEQFVNKETVSVASLIQTLLKQFEEQFQLKNITYSVDVNYPLKITANKILLEVLITNLISNAIKYNVSNGLFKIILEDKWLIFCNTGETNDMDTTTIFERFTKNAANKNSIGLGLAIVKRICDISGYEIIYHFNPTKSEHTFKIAIK